LKARAPARPLFLKIAPDLALEAVDEIVDIACAQQIDGVIATNTTLARPVDGRWSSEEGGLSGAPLRSAATRIIHRIYARSEGRLPIFGVGGVFCADQAYEKIRAGASVVQLYTGLIYEGPGLVHRMLVSLALLLNRDGFRSVTEAVGADHRSVQRRAHL
jgi:dihydroorotate dehydrogenase